MSHFLQRLDYMHQAALNKDAWSSYIRTVQLSRASCRIAHRSNTYGIVLVSCLFPALRCSVAFVIDRGRMFIVLFTHSANRLHQFLSTDVSSKVILILLWA